jgi:hypothetical protein
MLSGSAQNSRARGHPRHLTLRAPLDQHQPRDLTPLLHADHHPSSSPVHTDTARVKARPDTTRRPRPSGLVVFNQRSWPSIHPAPTSLGFAGRIKSDRWARGFLPPVSIQRWTARRKATTQSNPRSWGNPGANIALRAWACASSSDARTVRSVPAASLAAA